MHELVQSYECGLAMWRCPLTEVSAELDRKMHDEDWLVSAGAAARELAENSFDRDILARQVISVLEAAVEKHPEKAESIAPGIYTRQCLNRNHLR
jgi:hypothetical protein